MKRILTIALSLLALTFAVNAQSKNDTKISEVKLSVNVHCDMCKQRIEKNIPFEKGIKDVDVNLSDKTVTVKYDNTKTEVETIKGLFKKLGYEAEVAKENAEAKETAQAKTTGGCCKK